jgi:hypothetical protein
MRVNEIANQSEWAFVFATELMYCGLRWFEMKSSNLQLKSSKELHRPPSFSGGFVYPFRYHPGSISGFIHTTMVRT